MRNHDSQWLAFYHSLHLRPRLNIIVRYSEQFRHC